MSKKDIERVLQAFVKVGDALENLGALGKDIKQLVGEIVGVSESKPQQASIGENVFTILKWEASKGSRLGDFDVAFKASNMPDPWQHAYNILKANNATIKNHYDDEGYQHYYWIYPEKYTDRIFRKKREVV